MIGDKEKRKLATEAISRMEGALATLKSLLGDSPPSPQQSQTTPTAVSSNPSGVTKKPRPSKAKFAVAESLPADQLGPVPDFESEEWPMAVQPHLIVRSDADDAEKQFRALQVVGIMAMDFNDTVTLDFGCGEGHVAKEISTHATKVVGYDIKGNTDWNDKKSDNLSFTTSVDQVKAAAPYDRVILYDVLDHLKGDDPIAVLTNIRDMLKPGGIVFCRCHPWTARHGSHLYEQINKAYLHLALTPDELAKAGYVSDYNLRLVKPMAAYNSWFAGAGFTVERKITSDPIPEFFSGPILDRIIKVTWGGNMDRDKALKIMGNQHCDYFLTRGT